mgnify:CR=1 FL=1
MERSFHMLLFRAFHARRSYLGPSLKELGFGSGQPKLVDYLDRRGPCRQRELSDYFEVDPAAVSRMLDALERGGFVARRPDQTRRRRDLVEITDKGRQAHELWEERCQEMENVMLSDFTAEEREQFCDYLARAHRNLRASKGDRK